MKESKSVKKLLDYIEQSKKAGNAYHNRYDTDKVTSYFASLSEKEVKLIVSDKFWNTYPSWVSHPKVKSRRALGNVLSKLIREMCEYNLALKEVIINNSSGLLLCYAMDYTAGRSRLKAAKRALRSKDNRARLRATKLLPIRSIRKMVSDPISSVRNAAIKRIGIDNCAQSLMDDRDSWIRARGLKSADLTVEETKLRLDDINKESIYYRWEMLALLNKLPDEELLYYLDLADGWGASDLIRKRLLYAGTLEYHLGGPGIPLTEGEV